MPYEISLSTTYNCSIERAFKAAILCDLSKIHTGLWMMPKVTHATEDEDWGTEGAIKKVHVAKSWTQKGGFASTDKILERVENQYWVIEVGNFQSWILGFEKFVGKWETIELEPNLVKIYYTYYLHAKKGLLRPLQWMFAKLFWKKYMKQVLNNIKILAEGDEPILYD